MITDLRSDTLTLPCDDMRQAMHDAQVGDDVYGEDPTVNALEEHAADLLGKEAALFAPSGTQTNLLALLTHCDRGDEYIVGQTAHTYRFEGGGAAVLGSIQPQPIDFAADGTLSLSAVEEAIKPDDFHFARTKLVCLENTHNGIVLSQAYVDRMRALCEKAGLALHLDGARFFNALVDQSASAQQYAAPFDSISICLSKGLGAPVGSLLLGPRDFIAQARRWRKTLGGGMRQAGIIAAGGLYALQHNVQRLQIDHQHAAAVADTLRARFGADFVDQHTNMIHLSLPGTTYSRLRGHLSSAGVRVSRPRWVFHRDVQSPDVERLTDAISKFPDAA